MSYQGCILSAWLITIKVVLSHLAMAVFVNFLHCKVALSLPVFILHSLEEDHYVQLRSMGAVWILKPLSCNSTGFVMLLNGIIGWLASVCSGVIYVCLSCELFLSFNMLTTVCLWVILQYLYTKRSCHFLYFKLKTPKSAKALLFYYWKLK